MKRTEIKNIGISGVKVELNHSELVVLKGTLEKIKQVSDSMTKPKLSLQEISQQDILDVADEAQILLTHAGNFFSKLIPEEVMSLKEASVSLFEEDVKDFEWSQTKGSPGE